MVEVLSIARLSAADRARIEAVDPRVHLVDAGEWFDDEIIATWPAHTTRNMVKPTGPIPDRAARDAALAAAEIVVGSFPCILDVRARAHSMKWFHQRNAGANNLWRGDLWRCDTMVTTSRGFIGVKPIAEYAVAALFYFARDYRQAEIDRTNAKFDRAAYKPFLLTNKTVCIVGAGGIGTEIAKMLSALGVRVIGVRRKASEVPDGFAAVYGTDRLCEALGESHAAIVACQLTKETENLMNAAAFAALRPGAIVVNIARGEIVDEAALMAALDSGHLGGAAIDVYVGEFDHPPKPAMWQHPRILMTPHNSPRADTVAGMGIDIFCLNLRAYLDGKPLRNVIDWDRGY